MDIKKESPDDYDDNDDFVDFVDGSYSYPDALPKTPVSECKSKTEKTPKAKRARKTCPDELAIFNRAIVDKFQYDLPAPGAVYFLSHFHSDHYGGLGPRWSDRTLYCSTVTARLVTSQLRVDPRWVVPLEIDPSVAHDIGGGVSVTLLDANHCPGSAMFLFRCGGKTALHTGDFRYEPRILPPSLSHIDLLHIDTTFCSSEYDFPPQARVESTVVSLITSPDVLYVIGAYVIGKERILVKIIRERKCKVYVDPKRLEIIKLLDLPDDVMPFFTTSPDEANVHVVSMAQLSAQKLAEAYEKEYSGRYAGIVGFSPTGWVYPECVPKRNPKKGIRPYSMRKCGRCTIYCVPYSEHSSFGELRAFVERVNPDVIYPFESPNEAKRVSRLLRGEIETKGGFAHVDIGHFFATPVKSGSAEAKNDEAHPADDDDESMASTISESVDDLDASLAFKFAAEELAETPVKAASCSDVIASQRRMLKFINANNDFEQKRRLLLSTPMSSDFNTKKKRRKTSYSPCPQKEPSVDKTQRSLFEFFN